MYFERMANILNFSDSTGAVQCSSTMVILTLNFCGIYVCLYVYVCFYFLYSDRFVIIHFLIKDLL